MLQLAITFISEGMVLPCTLRLKVDGGLARFVQDVRFK